MAKSAILVIVNHNKITIKDGEKYVETLPLALV